MKIISVVISPYPKSLMDPMPTVTATMEDGSTTVLFTFYPDEISFRPEEFIGLTAAEANTLKFKKDQEYLCPGRIRS